ncbi:MAG TPA: exodeoxyribonuclease V subunit alpha [Syntrophorhabdaceae bacterium]|nr:exodeoxyribonuclease V subunit alpha [Syntrophorhabdaceae bacterium]
MFDTNNMPFKGIQKYFADFMVSLSDNLREREKYHLWLASILLVDFVKKGHICIDLKDFAEREFTIDEDGTSFSIKCPSLETWIDALKKAEVVGTSDEFRPLILRNERMLYLNRYWQYEKVFVAKMLQKISLKPAKLDNSLIMPIINRLFPETDEDDKDMQKMAAINAVENNFLVISGGPGTGKTFTISKILALLIEAGSGNLSIALAAPTGKAAARLKAMIKDLKMKIDCPEYVRANMPEEVYTIHRLLGLSYRTRRFEFNEKNPLPYDVVIVDEGSMVDLPLMSKLLEATKDSTKIILVGDKDQLSSVEPGAVFGELCETIQDMPNMIVILKKNFRFGRDSGINRLAELIKEGNGHEAMHLIKEGRLENISWREVESQSHLRLMIENYIVERYTSFFDASSSIEEVFLHFDKFHVLCALRHGPFGILAINDLIEKALSDKKIIRAFKKWYRGKPIMITANDYSLKLFNGDTGIIFEDPENSDFLKIFFKTEEGLKKIAPQRIADFETAYAITVHKSQGSEFDDIVFILSDTSSEIFTRELIYTAITRAKRSIEIWGNEQLFIEAIKKRIERKSGIKDAFLQNKKTCDF